MLALAIISTIILGSLILVFFGVSMSEDGQYFKVGMFSALALAFVIVSIWILYAR